MVLIINLNKCEHLKDVSYYNNNYYRLPFSVEGMCILYEEYDGGDNFEGYYLGELIDNKFEERFELCTMPSNNIDEIVTIDSTLIKAISY